MSEKDRVFGYNLRYYLWKDDINATDFANRLGYSLVDLWRIESARVFLDSSECEDIAAALGISLEDMYVEQSEENYENAGCFECRGCFENSANKKKILDLFDTYCDIQEMLFESKV